MCCQPAADAASAGCGNACARRRAYGVCVHRRLLTPDLVTELRRDADLVFTWPVDTDEALHEAHHLGVDAVIGKNLSLLTSDDCSDVEGCVE